MKFFYHPKYNIDLGLLNYLHPFDGRKFKKVYADISRLDGIDLHQVNAPVSLDVIEDFCDVLLKRLIYKKRYILRALEVPNIPLLPFSVIDNRILLPMRWGVSGTLAATRAALKGEACWNLSGGYHHASRASSEGFCIYNDIGITEQVFCEEGLIDKSSKILIVDIDAHHGNGNAYTFLEQDNVTLFDIYNDDIYPQSRASKERLNINIPLQRGTSGETYLSKLEAGLSQLHEGFDLAFVVAGTDVISTDPLGGLSLSVADCVERDKMVYEKLNSLSVPMVFLGGGGYSSDSARAITESIINLHQLNKKPVAA